MKLKLSILERLSFQKLYPQQSNLINQILIKDLIDKLKINQEEMEKINMKSEGSHVQWDNAHAQDKEINFTDAEINLLKSQIDKLDREQKISQDIVNLCIKIKDMQK